MSTENVNVFNIHNVVILMSVKRPTNIIKCPYAMYVDVKLVVMSLQLPNMIYHTAWTPCHIIRKVQITWWRHQMETFSALLALCAGNSPVPGEFPTQRPVTRSFDVFFDMRPNKQLSKQPWGWWFERPWWSLWRHRNDQLSCKLYDT